MKYIASLLILLSLSCWASAQHGHGHPPAGGHPGPAPHPQPHPQPHYAPQPQHVQPHPQPGQQRHVYPTPNVHHDIHRAPMPLHGRDEHRERHDGLHSAFDRDHRNFEHNYFEHHGHHFQHGWYYDGWHHNHWSDCQWFPAYGCYLYYDPWLYSWYYWCAPDYRFYPITYCPYNTYVFDVTADEPAVPDTPPPLPPGVDDPDR